MFVCHLMKSILAIYDVFSELKSSGDLNFAVKSLDQIRKEKLERAKRLIGIYMSFN